MMSCPAMPKVLCHVSAVVTYFPAKTISLLQIRYCIILKRIPRPVATCFQDGWKENEFKKWCWERAPGLDKCQITLTYPFKWSTCWALLAAAFVTHYPEVFLSYCVDHKVKWGFMSAVVWVWWRAKLKPQAHLCLHFTVHKSQLFPTFGRAEAHNTRDQSEALQSMILSAAAVTVYLTWTNELVYQCELVLLFINFSLWMF